MRFAETQMEVIMNHDLERYMMKELIAVMAGLAVGPAIPLAVIIAS